MIVNLTPHSISITLPTGPLREIPPRGPVAHPVEVAVDAGMIDGVAAVTVEYAGVADLPEPAPGTWLVVSPAAARAAELAGRPTADLLVPGQQVRDSAGRAVGCLSLARYTGGHKWRLAANPPESSGYYLATCRVSAQHEEVHELWFAAQSGEWFHWRYVDQAGGCDPDHCHRRTTPIKVLAWMRVPPPSLPRTDTDARIL